MEYRGLPNGVRGTKAKTMREISLQNIPKRLIMTLLLILAICYVSKNTLRGMI